VQKARFGGLFFNLHAAIAIAGTHNSACIMASNTNPISSALPFLPVSHEPVSRIVRTSGRAGEQPAFSH
jgi:hypothetical protein